MNKAINLLAVDDEENILNSLKRLLINEPYGIITTSNPDEALAIIAREPIKVILSDQRMPNVSGVELLKKVKEKYPDVIRILFTGYTDISAAEEAINVGQVYRFINKPWNSSELKSAIEKALHHYDLVVENRRLFDITKTKNEELELANRKLQALYETQKEFTSTISHELRTPLASIKAAIDIVLSGTPGPTTDDQIKFLTKAKSNIDRLNRLINDVLDLTKMEAGKSTLNFRFGPITTLIDEVIEIQKEVATAKGITLVNDCANDLPAIPFDPDKMAQVLNNLISNAIKFTQHGEVRVIATAHTNENHIEIRIRDTGAGISADDIPKLFQKFQQLGDPSKRQTGGTGLGLAICKEIVSRHNGKIWVESQEGTGSDFIFILPIQERRAN